MKKFIRTDWWRHSRLGKNRKKKQVWRRARGMHNKTRRVRRGYPVMPSIGFKSPRKESGKVEGFIPVLVHNITELSKLNKTNIAIIAHVGARKKLEILKKAEELKIKILNLNQGDKK
jgi:large subunit ribosomal protein L32e